jgi:hypothetical protein
LVGQRIGVRVFGYDEVTSAVSEFQMWEACAIGKEVACNLVQRDSNLIDN